MIPTILNRHPVSRPWRRWRLRLAVRRLAPRLLAPRFLAPPLLLLGAAGCASLAGQPPYTVVLDRLDEPRGLWLKADGSLCVAEAGRPNAPADGDAGAGASAGEAALATILADTGAVTCLDAAGQRSRPVAGLPYVLYSGTGVSVGPTAVGELAGQLYVLTGEGYGDLSRKLLQYDPSGEPRVTADLLEFAAQGKPLSYFQAASIPSNPYAMIPDPPNRRFLVTDGASGQVLAVGVDGKISVYTPVETHAVLTGIAWGPEGVPYTASFSQLPHPAGSGAIYRLDEPQRSTLALANLTAPIGLGFDRQGRLYVLEFLTAGGEASPYADTTGRLLRFERQGSGWDAGQVLVDRLPYPTAMLFGEADALYISVHGAFSAPGSGKVIRLDGLAERRKGRSPVHYQEGE